MLFYSINAASVGIPKLFLFTHVLAAAKQERIIAVVWFWYSSQQHYNKGGVRDFSPAQGQTPQTRVISKEQVNQEWPPKSSFCSRRKPFPRSSPVSFPVTLAKWCLCKCPATGPGRCSTSPCCGQSSHSWSVYLKANFMLGFGGAQDKRTAPSLQNLLRLLAHVTFCSNFPPCS